MDQTVMNDKKYKEKLRSFIICFCPDSTLLETMNTWFPCFGVHGYTLKLFTPNGQRSLTEVVK